MNERIAPDNKWLTNATVENEADRIFAKKVSGYGDLDSIYREASQEEKDKWEEEYNDINEQEEQL